MDNKVCFDKMWSFLDNGLQNKNKQSKVIYHWFKLLLISCVFGVMSINSYAGEDHKRGIEGQVTYANKQPVGYATVFIRELNKSVLTNEEGRFYLTGLPYGTYEVEINSLEIQPIKQTVVFSSTSKNLIITATAAKGVNLEEMVIDVQTDKKRIESSGFAVNVINTKDVALQSIQTNELLDRTAGVKIRQDGGLGSRVNYNLNGLSGRAIKIFIDGIPSSNYGSSFSLNSISPSAIERIEVYKGVVPTYLSDDALGGAINIVLKQKQTNTLNVSGGYGSFGTHQYNVNGSYRADNGFTFSGTGFFNYSKNNYRVNGPQIRFVDGSTGAISYPENGAKRFHDAYQSQGGKFDIGFTDVKWADKFLIGGVVSSREKQIQHGSTMQKVYGDRLTKQHSFIGSLQYLKKDLLIEGLDVRLDATYSNLTRQIVDTVGMMYDWSGKPMRDKQGNIIYYNNGAEASADKSLQKYIDKTTALRANIAYEFLPNHTISANYFYTFFLRDSSDELQPKQLQQLVNTRDLNKSILSFNYENALFDNRLRMNIFYKKYYQKAISKEPYQLSGPGKVAYAVRQLDNVVDHNGYGASFSYKVWDKLYLLGSAEKAIRMPSEGELFGNNADNVLSAFNLKPEESTNFNIGFQAGPFEFKHHRIGLNATYFKRDTKGMIREAIDQRGNYTRHENLEKVLSTGIDVELNYSFKDKVFLTASVSKFNVLFNTPFDAEGVPYHYYKLQIRNEPSLKMNANLSYQFKDIIQKGSRLRLYYNVYYVEEFLKDWSNVGGTNLATIPTQYPNDMGLSYQFPSNKTTMSFDAKNILNQDIYDNFGLQKPGRAFYIKVTHSFFN
ncbi:TonB-dependent receptor [Myroides pelagicus]|nr:TonB-dependent receptor plug domain-containing protein [Myroides pelagicus]